jgi:asparaginyl-tRNA synthetase
VLTKNQEELKYFEKHQEREITSKLTSLTKKNFIRLDYTQALEILKKSPLKFPVK